MKFNNKLQTDTAYVHLRYLNELLPSNVYEIRTLIFSQVLIIYCVCYFKHYVVITRFTTGGYDIFITCPAKSMHRCMLFAGQVMKISCPPVVRRVINLPYGMITLLAEKRKKISINYNFNTPLFLFRKCVVFPCI